MNPQRPDPPNPDPQAHADAGGERERIHAALREAFKAGARDATTYYERASRTRDPQRFRACMDQMIDDLHRRDRELIRQARERQRCRANARREST